MAVARALLAHGDATHETIGRELLQCRKSLHPGVSLWNLAQSRDPAHIALSGDGCGAAMCASPGGVLYPSTGLDDLVRGAYECAIPTHGGPLATCAAAAVAAAVSAAVQGRSSAEVLTVSIRAARTAESLRPPGQTVTIVESIERTYSDLMGRTRLLDDEVAEVHFPNTPQKIVPLAISLAAVTQSAQTIAILAANLGGDSNSVASIGSAIAGALWPETVNQEWFEIVTKINGRGIVELAASLARRAKWKSGIAGTCRSESD